MADLVATRFKGSEQANGWPFHAAVILDLPARDALPIAGDGTVEELDDGRCLLRSGSWSRNVLAAMLLHVDTDIEAIEPAELTGAFELTGRHAASAAGGQQSTGTA